MDTNQNVTVKLYKRRWLMLLLMVVNSGLIVFQINQYSTASYIISEFYDIAPSTVVISSSIVGATYALLCYFSIKIVRKEGLKVSIIVSTSMSAIAVCIKCCSIRNGNFFIIFISQFFVGLSQCFSLPIYAQIAENWFGNNEAAFVVGANYASQMIANVIAFSQSRLLFTDRSHVGIARKLEEIMVVEAFIAFLLFISVVALFVSKPKHPPSISQHRKLAEGENVSGKFLLKIRDYKILVACIALSAAFDYTFNAVLNQVIFNSFTKEGATIEAIVGCLLMIFGFVGSLIIPFILDKSKNFKLIALSTFTLSVTLFACIQISLIFKSSYFLYVSAVFFGLTFYSRYGVLTDLIVEVTYPIPTATSFGIASFFVSLCASSTTAIISHLFEYIGVNYGLLVMCFILLLPLLLLLFCEWDLKRKSAEECNSVINEGSRDNHYF